MPLFLLLGVVLLVGFVLIAQWFAHADPKRLAGTLKVVAITAILAAGLFLLFRGGFGLIASLAALFYPLLARWRRLWDLARSATGSAGGQASRLETAYLQVELDHATGQVTGEIIQGFYAGRRLESLGLEELLRLLAEVRGADPPSAQVIETYLDRLHGDSWRERAEAGEAPGQGAPASSGAMSRTEAFRVLGLEPGADAATIRNAHRRLMLANHPDRGGSTYLAAQINRAKDVLLGN